MARPSIPKTFNVYELGYVECDVEIEHVRGIEVAEKDVLIFLHSIERILVRLNMKHQF